MWCHTLHPGRDSALISHHVLGGCLMAEHEAREDFGRVLWQEVARVIPWGILFIILILFFAGFVVRPLGSQFAQGLRGTFADPALKQDVKEAGEYLSTAVIRAVKSGLLDDQALKQDAKEALEYASQHLVTGPLSRSLRAALADPALKQDIKEASEYVATAVIRAVKDGLLDDPALKQDVKEALEYSSHKLAMHNSLLNRVGELEKHIQQLEYQNAELRKQQGGVSRGQ